ncbi:MAG: PilZ domain-containing protein [Gammaproteobacteria bacterium]
MEQRWSPRTNVNIDVDLHVNGEEITGCKTRDIGMGGVFVETHNCLPNDEKEVELIFNLIADSNVSGDMPSYSSDKNAIHALKATVVRITDDGLGLMFRDFDANAFRSLQMILHYAQTDFAH